MYRLVVFHLEVQSLFGATTTFHHWHMLSSSKLYFIMFVKRESEKASGRLIEKRGNYWRENKVKDFVVSLMKSYYLFSTPQTHSNGAQQMNICIHITQCVYI